MHPARSHVVEVLEATGGGTRRHLRDLVTGLDRDRFTLSVIASPGREAGFLADVAQFRAADTRVELVPMRRSIHPWHDTLALTRILARFRTLRPDVVHTHSSKAGFLGRCAARLAHVPAVVHTPHCFAFCMDAAPAVRRFYLQLERLAGRWTDRVICVCAAERELALRQRLAPTEHLIVIENGIAPRTDPLPAAADRVRVRQELGIPADAFVIGMVGRLCRQKGHRYLLAAAQQIRPSLPHARYVFIGHGELQADLSRLAHDLAVADLCTWLGHREDATRFYPGFDVLAMPSLWEALPYSLLDAMAAGTPVVVTATGGMPDAVLPAATGLVVAPGDTASLAGAILRLAGEPELRERFSVNARRTVASRFRLADMIRQTETLYTSMPAK